MQYNENDFEEVPVASAPPPAYNPQDFETVDEPPINVYDQDSGKVIEAHPRATAGQIKYYDGVQNNGMSPRDAVGYTEPKQPMDIWDKVGKWFNMPMSAAIHSMAQLEMNIPKSVAYASRAYAASPYAVGAEQGYAKNLTDKIDSFSNKVDAGLEKDVKFYHDKMGFGFDLVGGLANIPTFMLAGPAVVGTMMGGASEDSAQEFKKAGYSDAGAVVGGGTIGLINGAMQKLYLGRLSYAIQNEARPLLSKLVSAGTNAAITGTIGQLSQEGILQAAGVSDKTAGQVGMDVLKTDLMFGFGEGATHIAEHIGAPKTNPANIHPTDPKQFPNGVRYTDTDPTSGGFKVAQGIDAQNGVDLQSRPKNGITENSDGTSTVKVTLPGQKTAPEQPAPSITNSASDILHAAATGQITPEVAKSALEAIGHPSPDSVIKQLPEAKKIVSDKADQLIQEDYQKANENPDLVTNTLKAMAAANEGDTLTLRELIEKEGGQVPPELKDVFDEIETEKTVQKAKQAKLEQSVSGVEDTDPKIIAARVKKLDADLALHDQRIDDQLTRISDLNKAGRPQKAAENKLEAMLKQRETMADELAGLETTDNKTVIESKSGKKISERDAMVKEAKTKDVTVKGEDIAKAARDKAAARIDALQRGIKSGKVYGRDETRAVQKAVIKIINDYIKNSPHLDNAEKSKFLIPLKDINTFEKLQKNLPLLQSMLRNAEYKTNVRGLRSSLREILQSTKVTKQNKKLLGKFNPELQGYLDDYRGLGKLSKEGLDGERQKTLNTLIQDAESNSLNEIDRQRIGTRLKLIEALHDGSKATPDQLSEIKNEISALIKDGKDLASERAREIQSRRDEITEKLAKGVASRYPKEKIDFTGPKIIESAVKWFEDISRSTDDIGKYIFYSWSQKADFFRGRGRDLDKKIDDFLNVIPESGKRTQLIARGNKAFAEKINEIYGIPFWRAEHFALEKALERVKLPPYINAAGKLIKKPTYTRSQLMELHALFQRPEARSGLLAAKGNGFTEDFENSVSNALSKQDKDMVAATTDLFDNVIYPEVNPVFNRLNFVDLPKSDKYFPISRDIVSEADMDMEGMFGSGKFMNGVSPSFLKEAVNSTKPLRIGDGLFTKFTGHLNDAANYVAFAEKIREQNATIFSAKVKKTLQERLGNEDADRLLSALRSAQKDLVGQGYAATTDHWMKKLWSAAGDAVSATSVMARPMSAMMQLSTAPLYANGVNKIDFAKGWATAATNPKKAWEVLKENPVLADRYANWENKFDFISPKTMPKIALFRRRPAYKRYGYMPLQVADMGVVVTGAYARYYALTQGGMDHAHALTEVAERTEATQQPKTKGSTPDIFKGFYSPNSKFMSGQVAGLNVLINSIRDVRLGRITPAQFSGRAATAVFTVGIIPTILQQLFSHDDHKDELDKLGKGTVTNMVGSVPVLGGMALYAADKLLLSGTLGSYEPRTIDPMKVAADMVKGFGDIKKIKDDAFLHYDKNAYLAAKAFGLATRTPANTLYGDWIGLQEMFNSNPDGLLRVMGRTQNQIDGEKLKKPKKKSSLEL